MSKAAKIAKNKKTKAASDAHLEAVPSKNKKTKEVKRPILVIPENIRESKLPVLKYVNVEANICKELGKDYASCNFGGCDQTDTFNTHPYATCFYPRSTFPLFVRTLTAEIIIVDLLPDDTVEILKQKIQSKEGLPCDQQRLIFGGKQLEDGHSVSAYGIRGQCTVHVCLRLRGGGVDMVDLHENPLQEHAFSSHGPKWRQMCPGMALQGECPNVTCEAYGAMVVCNLKFGHHDINKVQVKCPMCNAHVPNAAIPMFYQCWIQYSGQREDGVVRASGWIECGGTGFHKPPEDAQSVKWRCLVFRVESKKPSWASPFDSVPKVALSCDAKCTICRLVLDRQDVASTCSTCGQLFHARCIKVWLDHFPDNCVQCHQSFGSLDPTKTVHHQAQAQAQALASASASAQPKESASAPAQKVQSQQQASAQGAQASAQPKESASASAPSQPQNAKESASASGSGSVSGTALASNSTPQVPAAPIAAPIPSDRVELASLAHSYVQKLQAILDVYPNVLNGLGR